MKILVTGGTGYIGSHTTIELLNQGHEVIIIDNFYNSHPEVLIRIEELSGKVPKFYKEDVINREALEKIFSENEIDAVIHFAGYKAVGESVEKPIEYYYNNLTSTLTLCEVMKKFNVKNLIFSSSATVYGLNNISPLKENLPLSTTNPYGTTKLMIEQILTDLYKSDNTWSIALLRYFNPIGAHESGRIGENPNGIPNNLMPYITQVAVGKREVLSVYGNDYETIDGTGVRDYIHVVDLAKGHIKALERHIEINKVEAYNLGGGKGFSVLQLVEAFEKVNEVKIPYKIVGRREGDVAVCYSDAEKALKELNWKAEKTIEDMCKDSWNWQKNNPKGYEK